MISVNCILATLTWILNRSRVSVLTVSRPRGREPTLLPRSPWHRRLENAQHCPLTTEKLLHTCTVNTVTTSTWVYSTGLGFYSVLVPRLRGRERDTYLLRSPEVPGIGGLRNVQHCALTAEESPAYMHQSTQSLRLLQGLMCV